MEKVEEKLEIYLGNKIVAWRNKWQPLNLGECNDGSKFTAVNQAVNQAKDFVNCCNEQERTKSSNRTP